MSEIKLFEKEEFGKVRVVMQDEDPWFVASDVAKALGYEKPNNAVNEHCKKMNKITLDPNLGGRVATVSTPPIQAIIIPESDVYRLVMRSNLPRAVEFQDWICEEVIPSIRKTGAYATNNALTMPNFSNPAEAARAWADEYEAKQRSALILLKRMRKPPFLDRFGGSCYRKVVTPRADSIGLVLQWGECVGASSSVEPTNTKRIDDMNDSVKSLVEVSTRTINGKEVLAVTSLQVAEHFEKEHYNVLRDIESVLSQVPENFVKLNFECYEYPVETGIGTRTAKAYLLSKDAFTLLTMGYTGEKAMAFKIAYIARFNEMEEQLRAASPLLPDFRDPIAAAEAWIVAERARLAEQARADYYQRTKAEIGSRREATAMATASVAVRKAAALENELGRGRDYKSVKGIPWFLDVFADTPAAYSVAGRKLSDMSRRMGYNIREIEDSRFGSVKAYHVDVIEAFRLALKNDLNMMRKYRR